MPSILSFGDKYTKVPKENLFSKTIEWFKSQDRFTKGYLITFLFIVLATPFIVSNLLETRQKAEAPQGNINKPSELPKPPLVPDEILVRFKAGTKDKAKKSVEEIYGLNKKESLSKIGVDVFKVPSQARDNVIAVLNKHKTIEYAEPNYIAEVLDTIPNDPDFGQQWGPQKVKAPAAWDITTGSGSVIVAVIDTGVMVNHSDLMSKVIPGYDFVNNDSDPSDDYGHGTQVAGIIGATTNNGLGIAAMAWQSPLLPIKVCDAGGSCSYDYIANGLIYAADSGAKVINLSLGGLTSSTTLEDAVNYAWNKGTVVVAAAGNCGCTAIRYPAKYANVVAVSSTGQTDLRSSFANYGSQLDVMAPGEDIFTTTYNGEYWRYNSGTSFSAPHVAGAAALLWAKGATTNQAIVDALTQGAKDLGDPGWDQYYGWGRLDIYQSLQKLSAPPADTAPPTTSITSPTNGASVSGVIDITDNASDNVGVTKVEFYIDSNLLGTDLTSPYVASWDTKTVGNGSHALTTKAYDTAGNVGTSTAVTVTVNNPVPDTTPPTTSVTSPTNGSAVSVTVTISANATDNVAVASVSFFIDGVFIGEDMSSSYSVSWDTSTYTNGNHTIYSKAVDAANNVGTSTTITVTVNNLVSPTNTPTPTVAPSSTPKPTLPPIFDTTPPTVSISYPTSGTVLVRNSTITIAASATDNVGVARVEFYINGSLTCTDTTTLYACSWKILGKPNASYTITARAYDTSNNTSVSAINVTTSK